MLVGGGEYTVVEILKYLVQNDKINLEEIEAEIELRKNNDYLNKHEFNIWQGKNGKWYTYLPDEKKGRIQRERKTREEIEDLVISFYREKEENPIINDLFYEWLNRKLENNEIIESTYTRYKVDFERCKTDFMNKRIKSVDEIDIEDFLKKIVHEKKMSRKAYSNMRTLLYGMFRYAKKKRYVQFNIKDAISDIEFSKKEFTTIKHDDIEQVFFEDEEKRITDYMIQKPDLQNLGLLLIFVTGLRIGELCTLRQEDIQGNIIEVNRTETRYKDRATGEIIYAVKESPKTEAGIRRVVVKDNYIWILKKIKALNPFGEYVFMKNGERIKSSSFRNRLYYNCKRCGVVVKSPHKARKTYGTKLYDSDIPKSLICDQMGHTDISCLQRHYYYNRLDEKQKTEALNNISNL